MLCSYAMKQTENTLLGREQEQPGPAGRCWAVQPRWTQEEGADALGACGSWPRTKEQSK